MTKFFIKYANFSNKISRKIIKSDISETEKKEIKEAVSLLKEVDKKTAEKYIDGDYNILGEDMFKTLTKFIQNN